MPSGSSDGHSTCGADHGAAGRGRRTGLTAVLTVERLAGPGAAGSTPARAAMAFVERDTEFQKAEAQALACVAGHVALVAGGGAGRRALAAGPARRQAPARGSQGDSAGAALALALAKLCAPPGERLAALDLAQVRYTATIDGAGNLGAVAGLWDKTLAAAHQAAELGLLRRVVVSDQQADVPPELLRPNATPLRVIRAATLAQAVEKNSTREHGPRFAVREHKHRARRCPGYPGPARAD